jgi:dipeptidyl-peptidase-4
VSHDGTAFVDQWSSAQEPSIAAIRSVAESAASATPAAPQPLFSAREFDPRLETMRGVLTPPQFVSFPSTDGKVTLQAALYVPDPAVYGAGPHPTVVSCYGGPHVQYVQDSWRMATADLRAQLLRAQVRGHG